MFISLFVITVLAVFGSWTFAFFSTLSERYDSKNVSANNVPYKPVAIVFGARVNGAEPSPYLEYRIEAAVTLYKAGRVRTLLMSGDNSRTTYDEPSAMAARAIKLGVKSKDVVLDYAGFSTYDTCYRAKHVFGVSSAVLVSQNYHLPRAVFTCTSLGIRSIGYGAYATHPLLQAQYTFREWFSTDKSVIQLLFHEKSKFIGPKEYIHS